MKRGLLILGLVWAGCLVGCEMDQKMAETRVSYFDDTVPAFYAVQDNFFELADKMVRGRFQERRAVAKQQMDEWWSQHTADSTAISLVNDNSPAVITSQPADYVPTGVVFEWNRSRTKRFPVRAETMRLVMDAYAKAIAQTDKDEAIWDQLCREYKAIRDPFRKITTKQEMLEKDYADTQKKMAEFRDRVLTTAVGLGAGVGVGALAF